MFKTKFVICGLLALAGSLSAQVEPHAGQWKTWILTSGSEFRLPAHPMLPPPPSSCNGSRSAHRLEMMLRLPKFIFGMPAPQATAGCS